MAEWSIAAVLKTVDCNRSGGSNPSSSARKPQNLRFWGFFIPDSLKPQACKQAGMKKPKRFTETFVGVSLPVLPSRINVVNPSSQIKNHQSTIVNQKSLNVIRSAD